MSWIFAFISFFFFMIDYSLWIYLTFLTENTSLLVNQLYGQWMQSSLGILNFLKSFKYLQVTLLWTFVCYLFLVFDWFSKTFGVGTWSLRDWIYVQFYLQFFKLFIILWHFNESLKRVSSWIHHRKNAFSLSIYLNCYCWFPIYQSLGS